LVFAIGVAMIILPGPAFLVIPAGLAILALEFVWARQWLRSLRAVLPRKRPEGAPPRKFSFQSVGRSLGFLFRQVRRTLLPKSKPAPGGQERLAKAQEIAGLTH
jgi:hypothetical protein